ncbi:hypothetical protein E3P92_03351 [Wallemia ichthyophaga]|uniref:Uncharacterized protein n=2 Tax=Wallemia ichthyophaga TaxID=245174 RepID=A0A4T0L822_WALIC|nr:uncharacterized protein J056_003122 [Wallemia ichthyophaga EXF-994]TIA69906.1 hypothetical protein E3P91_03390 [Wallemia ichthyophaga]EOR03665.1 hypothetical protein J056_003122 [Wallemia ichthyophaga EXF-994]TIA79271.1 hypothetical protein E3P98_03400 [Wallemia ichthyophaga]TIA88329.1 hypothetical protein E3P97_03570 [Wallemia ichthyophaga]TIA96474.1 hypothetical protein E3P95_03278 [Wallemia ichthyophaga]
MNNNFATDTTFDEHIHEVVGYLSRSKSENEKMSYLDEYQSKLVDLNDSNKKTIIDKLLSDMTALGGGSWSG